MPMLFAVLTVSDRCSQGLMTDTAGPAVVDLLRQHWPAAKIDTGLVPDDEDTITARLLEWTSIGTALILTVGGTGLSPRDRTPEATLHVIDRYVPGTCRGHACPRRRKQSLRMALPRDCRHARLFAHRQPSRQQTRR